MPIYPPTFDGLLAVGRELVRTYQLHKRYPQPELDREAFVRQVKGSLPPYLWPCVDLDPFGIACGFPLDGEAPAEFLFPNLTGLGAADYERDTDGILEAAKHRIKLDIPKAEYAILIDYVARGGPGKPAQWYPHEYYVSGLEYRTVELAVAVALATGDYPEKEAK